MVTLLIQFYNTMMIIEERFKKQVCVDLIKIFRVKNGSLAVIVHMCDNKNI